MAVLKYKDSSGVWRRLCQNGDTTDTELQQKTHEIMEDMVEDLIPSQSSISEIVSALKMTVDEDDMPWLDVKVQGIINALVDDLYSETATNGELITALKDGSSVDPTSSATVNTDTWMVRVIKKKINDQVGLLDAVTSSIKDVIVALKNV